jgi:hypothetical protein
LIKSAIENVIKADKPVITFTENDKRELNTTYPIIFLSKNMAKEAVHAANRSELQEVYIKQLLVKDIDIIYTTTNGCDFVKQKMRELGNETVLVICQDKLFMDSDWLTDNTKLHIPSKPERDAIKAHQVAEKIRWKEWKKALPLLDDDSAQFTRIFSSGLSVGDLAGKSEQEIKILLEDLVEFEGNNGIVKYEFSEGQLQRIFYMANNVYIK